MFRIFFSLSLSTNYPTISLEDQISNIIFINYVNFINIGSLTSSMTLLYPWNKISAPYHGLGLRDLTHLFPLTPSTVSTLASFYSLNAPSLLTAQEFLLAFSSNCNSLPPDSFKTVWLVGWVGGWMAGWVGRWFVGWLVGWADG